MKRAILLIALVATVVACGGNKEEKSSAKVNLVENYLALKDALVATDGAKAQTAAKAFLEVNNNDALTADLKTIASSTDVAAQRIAFEGLSSNMYSIVKASGSETVLYKQYCPMAFNNKGAYWLAAEEEVNNPYFGDVMLHCGSVQETINQ
ncbi:uncharacterized protein DUF3347 [Roseivirga ehrenbergii]|uniref:DUF3347 domain-containing protein n=1 Tax=Roseivirga ehrenbergii (strain DSM 102268 / JCM 13514 / KCTC 12282 / NCIMB 14502 / KMM 6017) TaxID=279360 RepID=A0A150XLN5_ROSEK|nr:DUF3347 domain-containing protein [Roseivirga ehrenbergii]KYG79542.1 hypothetical protein MB14_16915 [Roseivirga ehrenbergii]TCL01015.1 uncharacterized protein DUF3347 [Roseivirga ehrenbergii]